MTTNFSVELTLPGFLGCVSREFTLLGHNFTLPFQPTHFFTLANSLLLRTMFFISWRKQKISKTPSLIHTNLSALYLRRFGFSHYNMRICFSANMTLFLLCLLQNSSSSYSSNHNLTINSLTSRTLSLNTFFSLENHMHIFGFKYHIQADLTPTHPLWPISFYRSQNCLHKISSWVSNSHFKLTMSK